MSSITANPLLPRTFLLWEGQKIPFNKDCQDKEYEEEIWGSRCVLKVTIPTLTIYPPQGTQIGVGVVILPGGGYTAEAIHPEGHDVARALTVYGITAGVLKYRLPDPITSDFPERVASTDVRQAIKRLRLEADGLKHVGVLGFSAGSHLATVVSLEQVGDPLEKLDFSGLMYGTTNLSDINLEWLEKSLYYRKLSPQEIVENRLLERITERTPPTFLVHACDDDVCKLEETTLYAQKLLDQGIPMEMHLFPRGGHGFGLGRSSDGTDQWLMLFVNWLKRSFSTV